MKKILLCFTLILALAAGFGAYSINSRLQETAQNKTLTLIEVPKGSSPTKIFQILQKNGIWSDELAFKIICHKQKPNLKAGWFEIPAGLTLPQVLTIIESGKNAVKK